MMAEVNRANRLFFGGCFLTVIGLLGFSAFQQFALELEPCPLCVLQRLAFAGIGVTCGLAAAHGPGRIGGVVYCGAVFILALAGGAVAARHVWLQHLPEDQVPTCGPGLDYLMDTFSPGEALMLILGGSGECAEVNWQFLGLGIPAWALVWFLVFGAASVLWGIRQIRST